MSSVPVLCSYECHRSVMMTKKRSDHFRGHGSSGERRSTRARGCSRVCVQGVILYRRSLLRCARFDAGAHFHHDDVMNLAYEEVAYEKRILRVLSAMETHPDRVDVLCSLQ